MHASEASIVVVHSRFQMLVVQHMVETIPELAVRDNHLVLDMARADVPLRDRSWQSVLELKPPVGGRVVGRGRACRAAMRQIARIAEAYERLHLLVSDIQWPLNNALYGALVAHGRPPALLENFPDGIGSLQLVYPSQRQKVKDVLKAALGRVGGLPFVRFRGDVMGLERSDRVYSLLPQAIPELADRTVQIPRRTLVTPRMDGKTVLFVGQNYEAFVPAARYRAIAASAARFTKQLGYALNLYKPHPLERHGAASTVFAAEGFEVLDEARTVEEMFFERRLACVVSYNSSALVHLKLFFGDDVRCVAVHNWDVLQYTEVDAGAREKMEALFALCGVENHV